MFILLWRYVDVTLTLCWYYVDAMLMLRWRYVDVTLTLCWCSLHLYVAAQKQGTKTILFTDGAPAYPSVAEKLGVQHEWVNHSKGQFTKTVRGNQRGKPKVLAHTGTIDACWKSCKMMIPNSLTSRHPMIKTYCKAWQWRFVNRSHQMSARTAKKLRKLRWRNGPKTCTFSHTKRETRWKIGTILQSLTHVKYRFRLNETTNLHSL